MNQRLTYEIERQKIQKSIIRKQVEISKLEWTLEYLDALAHGVSKAAARKIADMPKSPKSPTAAPEEMSEGDKR
jgi:hypothetical protein